MKVAKSVEQACSILAVLAEHHGGPVTSCELNKRLAVSPSYLTKIMRRLVVSGIIASTQGVNGGYVLARPMNAITLKMVVIAIEGNEPLFTPSGVIKRTFRNRKRVADRGLKSLSDGFAAAEAAWLARLDKVTMEPLITSSLGDDTDPTSDIDKK